MAVIKVHLVLPMIMRDFIDARIDAKKLRVMERAVGNAREAKFFWVKNVTESFLGRWTGPRGCADTIWKNVN